MSALHNTVTQLCVHVRMRECLHANLVSAGLNCCCGTSFVEHFLSWQTFPTLDPLLSDFVLLSLWLIVFSRAPLCFGVSALSSWSSEEPGDERRRRQDVPEVNPGPLWCHTCTVGLTGAV